MNVAEEPAMLGKRAVDAELSRSLGLSVKKLEPLLAVGGDAAEKQFMECCWCLWKANGAELVEPFIEGYVQSSSGEVPLSPFFAYANVTLCHLLGKMSEHCPSRLIVHLGLELVLVFERNRALRRRACADLVYEPL